MEVIDRHLGKILIDEMTVEDALASAAQEVYDIMADAGYNVLPLE